MLKFLLAALYTIFSAAASVLSSFKSNQIKSLLLSHHHSTSALVSEILTSVLQTVQKNNRQFTYGQTVQKNNKQFTYGQTVQKNNKQFTYGQTVQNNKQFTYGQTVQKNNKQRHPFVSIHLQRDLPLAFVTVVFTDFVIFLHKLHFGKLVQ